MEGSSSLVGLGVLSGMVQSGMSENDACRGVPASPFTVLLGVAQDGGYPQAGCTKRCCEPAWRDPTRAARAVSLGVVDPESGECWLIDASPDFPSQLHDLDLSVSSPRVAQSPTGVFLTHAHIGHYTGLMYLGCLLYTSPSPRDATLSRMPSSA